MLRMYNVLYTHIIYFYIHMYNIIIPMPLFLLFLRRTSLELKYTWSICSDPSCVRMLRTLCRMSCAWAAVRAQVYLESVSFLFGSFPIAWHTQHCTIRTSCSSPCPRCLPFHRSCVGGFPWGQLSNAICHDPKTKLRAQRESPIISKTRLPETLRNER